jgi:hypothetical protein
MIPKSWYIVLGLSYTVVMYSVRMEALGFFETVVAICNSTGSVLKNFKGLHRSTRNLQGNNQSAYLPQILKGRCLPVCVTCVRSERYKRPPVCSDSESFRSWLNLSDRREICNVYLHRAVRCWKATGVGLNPRFQYLCSSISHCHCTCWSLRAELTFLPSNS